MVLVRAWFWSDHATPGMIWWLALAGFLYGIATIWLWSVMLQPDVFVDGDCTGETVEETVTRHNKALREIRQQIFEHEEYLDKVDRIRRHNLPLHDGGPR